MDWNQKLELQEAKDLVNFLEDENKKLREILETVKHMVACKVEAKLFIMNELEKLEKGE